MSEQSITPRVVFKYTPQPGTKRTIEIKGSNPVIRHVAGVGDDIQVWVEHDASGSSSLTVDAVPTGVVTATALPFIGTALLYDGRLVFHLYGEAS